jgi:hypothetical protein
MSENPRLNTPRVDESFGREGKRARTGLNQNKRSTRKWIFQIQNEKTKNKPNLDFSIEIQHDSYTAEVTTLPPSFDWN